MNELRFSRHFEFSFHSDEKFSDLFVRIELLLKDDVGYNHKGIYDITTLQYAGRGYYVHKLLHSAHKLHGQENDESSNPLEALKY
jgi:hypothetical protein